MPQGSPRQYAVSYRISHINKFSTPIGYTAKHERPIRNLYVTECQQVPLFALSRKN